MGGQLYSATSPFSIPWFVHGKSSNLRCIWAKEGLTLTTRAERNSCSLATFLAATSQPLKLGTLPKHGRG